MDFSKRKKMFNYKTENSKFRIIIIKLSDRERPMIDHHPQNNLAIIILINTYCLADYYCMEPVWGKITDVFS